MESDFLKIAPDNPKALIDDDRAAIGNLQRRRGWSPEEIRMWNSALSSASQALLAEEAFDGLDALQKILLVCERALDFVESQELLDKIADEFDGWAEKLFPEFIRPISGK